ncbi:MAG: hypothetical protein Q7S47_01960 [bacterium]|nr:hypothetical protein [bacterium]
MVHKQKIVPFIALAAFAAVFVFGCVFQALGDEFMHMQSFGYSVDHQQTSSGSHSDDHMNIAIAFPSASQTVPLVTFLLVLLSAVALLQQRAPFVESTHTRWRQRSRKEVYSEWNNFTRLFSIGILNPKIL